MNHQATPGAILAQSPLRTVLIQQVQAGKFRTLAAITDLATSTVQYQVRTHEGHVCTSKSAVVASAAYNAISL